MRLERGGLSMAAAKKILALGFTPFAIIAIDNVMVIAMNAVLQRYGGAQMGDSLVTCAVIAQSFMLVMTMPLGGISGGTQSILSYNYGARQFDRVRAAQKKILALCMGFTAIMFVLARVAGPLFVRLFTQDDEVAALSVWAIRVCTLAAVPAFNSTDEYSHYLRSYEVSRGYLTSEGNGGNDLFSYGRTFNSGLVPEFSAKDHVSLWDIGENADQRIDREKTQFYGFGNTALYAPTSYLPQAVGIRIADLFTDRPMVLAYAGRIANMLMFGLFFFFAIRLTPVGKNFLVLLGLVPVNIQSANSMSADALALALTVALAAFVLAMRYKQK